MQNRSGTGSDPISQLDAAMNETFAELANQGTGVSPTEVVRDAPPDRGRRRSRRSASPPEEAGDGTWLDREQRGSRTERERPPRRRAPATQEGTGDPAQVILDDADTDTDSDDDGRSAPHRREAGPQRDSQGRFLPSRTATDEDADDDDDTDSDEDADDDADQRTTGGRRYDAAEEADDEDDDVEPEGSRRADDDGEQEDGAGSGRRRRRFPRAIRQEIDRQVRAQVGRIVEERDALRSEEQQRQAIEAEALTFLASAIGTQETRDRLQQQVNNTAFPLQQRNQAAALLQRYQANEKYVRTYRTALLASMRTEQAERDQQVAAQLAKYKIRLDPAIVAKGDRSETLVHAVRQGILLERARNQAELDRLRRAASNRRGSESERAVRNGGFGRDSMASANGRRANGRVATVDRLRGAFGNDRGLAAGSQVPAPTDRILAQLRDGEITLADLGLA